VRAHLVALSTVLYAQGVPFLHAGSDLLRSKSLDRNSYDAGDWFNAIDWTGATTTFGRGLPLAGDNPTSWNVMRDRLVNPLMAPGPDARRLRGRRGPGHAAGPARHAALPAPQRRRRPRPGRVPPHGPRRPARRDRHGAARRPPGHADLDPAVDRVLVVINASPTRLNFDVPGGAGRVWSSTRRSPRAPTPTRSAPPPSTRASGRATVPPLTTVVFVAPRAAR
jgi:hypothetical protein